MQQSSRLQQGKDLLTNCPSLVPGGKYTFFSFLRGTEENVMRHVGVVLAHSCLTYTLSKSG